MGDVIIQQKLPRTIPRSDPASIDPALYVGGLVTVDNECAACHLQGADATGIVGLRSLMVSQPETACVYRTPKQIDVTDTDFVEVHSGSELFWHPKPPVDRDLATSHQ